MPDQPRVNERRFYRYPRGRIVAVFDDDAAVQSALESLRRVGVDVSATNVLTGAEGAASLDRSGRSYGLPGRLVRLLQKGAYEDATLAAHDAALRSGNAVLYVPAGGTHEAEKVAETLREAGGRHLVHFRRWSIAPL